MLALAFIPIAPRAAAAFAPAEERGGPIIDADVQRLMDEKPDEEHALIVSVELCRTPLNLEELLPTPEETNECTRLWRAWETLAEEFEEGCNEQLTQEMVDAAHAEAKAYDEAIVALQLAAYREYQDDYAAIVAESVPDVYETLRSAVGEKVRRVSESSKLLAVRADRTSFETICETPSIKRISDDIWMGPMLDNSRLNIAADAVHCPAIGSAYTGNGVKVAVVDDGIVYDHPRLPTADSGDDHDFTTTVEGCQFPGNTCTNGDHGTRVAGVIFCQPDDDPCGTGGDGLVGIAYDATLVNAKVSYGYGGGSGGVCDHSDGNCPPDDCDDDDYASETWSGDLQAFDWAVIGERSDPGPQADVINYSRGYVGYGDPQEGSDTLAESMTSLNVDWIVHASGASFIHSCGNLGAGDPPVTELSPPSGAYNCLSVGAYDDGDVPEREDAVIWENTAPGPTDDERQKPDICAPGADIATTSWKYQCDGEIGCPNCEDLYFLGNNGGTSFAAPHVTGVIALLLEARPSLSAMQMHALLVNGSTFMESLSQSDWDDQAGWGMLHAFLAVRQRNYVVSGTLDDPDDALTFDLSTVLAGEEVVITGAWHRAMVDEDSPVVDGSMNPAPANLDLVLQSKVAGGSWIEADTTVGSYDEEDGNPEDNIRRVMLSKAHRANRSYYFGSS